MDGFGFGFGFSPAIVGQTSSYDTDAQAYFTAMSSQPNDTRKGHINTLVAGLKTDGIWTKITALYLFAAHDSQAARVNVKTPSNVASAVNSPTFTTDIGYLGDGATSYIGSNLTASTIDRTNATIFAICNTLSNASLSPIMGWILNVGELRLDRDTLASNRVRIGASNSSTPTTNPLSDHFVAGRRTGTTQDVVVETSAEGSVTATDSATGATNAINFLSVSTSYGNSEISVGGWGVYLNNTEIGNLRTRLRTYLTAVGAL